MKELLKPYAKLMGFLAAVLGPDYEIALMDVGEENCIVAIENGSISNRRVGSPFTERAKEVIANEEYRQKDWDMNYLGVGKNGKTLRSSTYYIRDEDGSLGGMLTFIFDDSRYRAVLSQVLCLCHPDAFAEAEEGENYIPNMVQAVASRAELYPATLDDTVTEAIVQSIAQAMGPDGIPPSRMTQEERLQIVKKLYDRGIFSIKGTVPQVARALYCSEASIYRYIAHIRQEN